jgi:hypothetical protein
MSEQKPKNHREQNHSGARTDVTRRGNQNPQAADDELLTEEELERAHTGWRAEDEQDKPDSLPEIDNLRADTEDLEDTDELDMADDAVTDMSAREMRRDQSYRTGGDDHSPGIDSEMDSNAPKQDDMRKKKRGGSRGQSDWN